VQSLYRTACNGGGDQPSLVGLLLHVSRYLSVNQSTFHSYVVFIQHCELNMALMYSFVTESPAQITVVFGAVFLTTYFLYRRHTGSYNGRKLPPAMPSLPIIGSILFLPSEMKDLAEFCISPRNKLGKIFSFCLGPK